jgi:fumarylacetoacetase
LTESWVESANEPTDFPLANLPFGIFSRGRNVRSVGVAIGDFILDVTAAVEQALLPFSGVIGVFRSRTLNDLMSAPREFRLNLRSALLDLLDAGTQSGKKAARARDQILVPMDEARLHLPVAVGDYTDFYASIDHATNVGSMFRPDNPLLPNYKYVPIGYHGRASSIVVSGKQIRRPMGQTKAPHADTPSFGPSRMLDYESELGAYIATGNKRDSIISLRDAENHIFGYCLVNDWSARDIQTWEYQPLGPFLSKSFATTVSPWVVPAEAVKQFRVPARSRDAGDPAPLPYLSSAENEDQGGINARLTVSLASEKMRREDVPPMQLSDAPFKGMYWTMAQMIAHHTSNGCNLRTGDLIASGTVSGHSESELGCLLVLTRRGANPVTLPTGETRQFLEDGDEVIMRGYLGESAGPRIGFGECRGVILPALQS